MQPDSGMREPTRFLHVGVYGVFGIVFAACLLVQGRVWLDHWPADIAVWNERLHLQGVGAVVFRGHEIDQYPATTILVPGGVLTAIGLGGDLGLRLTMALLLSLVAGLTAAVAFLLRPGTLWWIFVGWLLVFQPLYTLSTPPSALFTPLSALFALVILLARERNDYSLAALVRVAICGGALLATRFETAAIFVAAATLYLGSRRTAALYLLPLLTFLSFLFFNPYFLHSPLAQLGNFVHRVLFHAEHFEMANPLVPLTDAASVAMAAFALACALLLSRRLSAVPRDFACFLVAAGIAIIVPLLVSRHHPAWLYYPAFFSWELMLPLLVPDAIRALPDMGRLQALASRKRTGTVFLAGYLAYQLWFYKFRIL